jgi:2-polyprenyl-6-methoxyphenol hydroxylase-like FAD-dependent oxidoreductase
MARTDIAGTDIAGTDAAGTDAAGTETPADQLRRLVRIVRERTGVDLPAAATPASAFTVQQGLPDRLVCGRVILVGDAAHLISPIGGQGMNLGWLDSLALASTLERALGRPAAAATLLDRYDRRRRRTARLALRQAGFNMAMGRPVHGVRLRLRNGAVRMLALPPASSLLARAFTMRWLQ